ncbi:DUF4179 domain-containing protein [Niallia sp. 03091]|uniref:DUF4179 domain-containing protein n=1 Tax=Niallia sp. 03091 TaxID=3458059 RepID=UPI00404472EE
MDEKELKAAIENINVPKDKVFNAMDRGLKRAGRTNSNATKKRILISASAAVILFGATLTSGFINPSMSRVLAKAPFIGEIFQEFEDSQGLSLAKQNLVTELNQSITKNGLTVKLTSAYFDGNVVSITGYVNGDLGKGHNEEGEVSFDVNFENNKGDHDPWLNGKSTDIRKKGKGYNFQWQMEYPYKEIKEKLTLPISIHYINGIKGDWNFNIPITQEKYHTLSIKQTKTYPGEQMQIGIKEIIIAKASSSLIMERESAYKNDYIRLQKAVDDKGNIYYFGNDTLLSESKEQEGYHKTVRMMMSKLHSNISSLTFYPILSISDPNVEQLLDTKSFTMKSKRTEMEIKVNDVRKEGDKLILDYQFIGLPDKLSKHKSGILKNNLAYEFTLVDKNYRNKIYPENHSVSRNKVTLLDDKTAHFQSVFHLNGEQKIENFQLENTILQFNFSSFIETKELSPFTVNVPIKNE